MALTFTYNATQTNVPQIYRATSAGTVFSANLATLTAFDYFTDTAVVNDAIYFAGVLNGVAPSDLTFTVGTALAAASITIVREYYHRLTGRQPMHDVLDNTLKFSVLGTNIVRFPVQRMRGPVTVNGLNLTWTRCRITAVNTITEGGANITNRVTHGDGQLTIAGGTGAIPATFLDVYNRVVANLTWITVTKRNGYSFDFTKIPFLFTGYCLTRNEVIEIGSNGAASRGNGRWRLNEIQSGNVTGNRGYNGSTFIVYGNVNSSVLTANNNTLMYGTTIKFGSQGGYPGYLYLWGTRIDCSIEQAIVFSPAPSVVINTRFVGNNIIASQGVGVWTGNSYICMNTLMLYVYGTSHTMIGFDFAFQPAGLCALYYIHQGSGLYNQVWDQINPSQALGNMASATLIPVASALATVSNLPAVFYYDTSAGTYTDYTAQAASPALDDVPLTGDVGDYYLFGVPGIAASSSFSLDFVITPQANDYVYIYEYRAGAVWIAINPTYKWDQTANLTVSGKVMMSQPAATLTTLNGYNGYRIRLRIVSVGATTPTATQIRRVTSGAVSNWNVNEKYSFDLKVVDNLGNAINGAIIVGKNQLGVTIFTVNTGITGSIVQQIVTRGNWHYDPVSSPINFIVETIYNTMSFTISKAGYETYSAEGVALGKKIDMTITLDTATKYRLDTEQGKLYLAIHPEEGSASDIVELG